MGYCVIGKEIHGNFEDWVKHIFDHEVRPKHWCFELDAPFFRAEPETILEYTSLLFEDPMPFLSGFTNAQLGAGLWHLISPSHGDDMCALNSEGIDLPKRQRVVRSFVPLFKQLYAQRCSEHLSHIDEPGADPLNASCYIWWDVLPLIPEKTRELDQAALETMTAILTMDSIACQESALHGLGHMHYCYPEQVRKIVEDFLRLSPGIRPELATYAKRARAGHVR